MPKVLRIINRLNIGGPTFNAAYLTRYMAPEFETMLVSGMKDDTEGNSEFILKNMGIEPHFIHEMKRQISFSSDVSAFRDLDAIVKKFKPDIVHTHMAKPGTLGRLAAIKNKVPVVIHTFHGHYFHSYFGPLKTRAFIQIERFLAKKTAGIIAISEMQKHDLSKVYKIAPPEKTFLVPLGFDLSRFQKDMPAKRSAFRKKYLVAENEVAIGIVGRLVAVKNHKLFLDAIKCVIENSGQPIKAFIIGDGELRQELENYASSNRIKFNTPETLQNIAPLTFTSWIENIDEAFAGLDVVALTSLNEGTPVSLIEAQAASKAIVATKAGGVENVVIENETALISNQGDHRTLFKNMLNLVENETLRNKLGVKGLAHVEQKFHYMRLVNDMKNLYNQLLASSK